MNKRKEKISAFLDNDMHCDALMSFSLSAEASDAKVMWRYQMIGETLRAGNNKVSHNMSHSFFVDVSHAVRETLRDENLSEAPQAEQPLMPPPSKTGFFDLSNWLKPVAGMAVAASVALVMVVSINEQNNVDVLPVASNSMAGNSMANNNGKISSRVQPVAQLLTDDKIINYKMTNLDPYINQHLKFASQDTLQGRLPYVRAVSFTPGNK